MEIKIDDEFKLLLPDLTNEEKATLEKSIIAEGCREPLIVWDGLLIDGHNRLEICQRNGIEFKTINRQFIDKQAAMDWIDENQLGRRNLSPDAFKLALGRRYNRSKKAAHRPEKRGQNVRVNPERTAETLAKEHAVNEKTVRRAGKFAEEVEKKPEYQEAIRENIPIKQVKKEERKEKTKTAETKAISEAKNDFTLTQDESITVCQVVITDPPYGILDEKWEPGEIEEFTRTWLSKWNDCGAEIIISFFSQRYLWDGKTWFDEELSNYHFQQLLIWHYPNNKSPQSRKGFKQTWEPIYFYRKRGSELKIGVSGENWGKELHDFDCHVAAVPQTNFNDENMKQHPAQKPVSVMRWLINATTKVGDIVCDPFTGSGTTGIASLQLNRSFYGIEDDSQHIKTAEGRIAKYGQL